MQIHCDGETVKNIEADLNPGGDDGPFVVLHFGGFRVYVESIADAKAVIAAGAKALALLDPAPHAFIRAGQVTPDRPAPDRCMECGQPEAAHPAGPKCWQCGATQAAAPLIESPEGGDWQCSNRQMCAGRQARRAATRDADTAKAGT